VWYKLWHVLVLSSSILILACSEDPDILFSKAETEAALGSRQKALNYLFEIQNSHPDYTEAYIFAAQLFFENNNFSEAVNQCKHGLNAEADSAEVYRYLGLLYSFNDNKENAYEYFRMAVESDPNNVEAHISLGKVLGEMNIYKQAIIHFNQALELDSANYMATVGKAQIYANLKRTADAIILLEAAIKDEPNRGPAYAMLAYTLENTATEEEAIIENYVHAVKLDPENRVIWDAYINYVGRWKNREPQDYMELIPAIKNFHSHYPDVIDAQHWLANVYFQLAELDGLYWLEAAKKQCKKVLAVDSNDHYSHYVLGRVYLLEEKPRLALLEAQLAFEMKPSSEYSELIDRAKLSVD
jgi:tetratricopeptide (TPR) repeat protein